MITLFIKKIITVIFKAIYKFLSIFSLQYLLLVLLIGIVLLIAGVFENEFALLLFYLAVIISIVVAIWLTIKRLLGLGGKKKKGVYIGDNSQNNNVNNGQEVVNSNTFTNNVAVNNQVNNQSQNVRVEPIYYAIRGKKGYYMAEFSDRYELYFNKNGTLVRIRTDYKVV